MSRRRRTLGAQLAWLVALSTALGVAAFTTVAAFVIWLDERYETDGDADRAGEPDDPEEEAAAEVVEDIGAAVVVAAPIGLLVAVAAARRSARRITARIDGLIATASRMTAEDLRQPLPLSSRDDELDALAVALNRVFGRIDDGIAALRRFAADASHELRTPLAVMINALEVARRRPRDAAEWERVAHGVLDELRQMADLVEALLQGARAGAFDLAAEPIEIHGQIEAIAGRWREPASAAGVTLAVAASSRARARARIDPRGLAIVVGNLIGNAIRHSPRGGTVTVRALARGDRIRVEVDDQGPGVPADERDRIFAPFVRGEPSDPEDRRSGTGLGLSIARRIVQAHGGSVQVEDAPGGGARFAVELPAAPVLMKA